MKDNKKNKEDHGLINNIMYTLKVETNIYPYIKWKLPISILAQVLIYIFQTLIPAVAVWLIVNKQNVALFPVQIGCVILLFCIVFCISDWSSQWVSDTNSWVRYINFGKKLIHKSITMDYDNLEPQTNQSLMEQGTLALKWEGFQLQLDNFRLAILNLIGLILYSTSIIMLDYRILAICFIMIISNLLLNKYARNYMNKYNLERADISRKMNSISEDATEIENGKDVRLYRLEEWFKNKYDGLCVEQRKWNRRVEKRWLLPSLSDSFFSLVRDVVLYTILIKAFLSGTIDIVTFTLYIGVTTKFNDWIVGIANAYAQLQKANIHINNYRKVIETKDAFLHNEGVSTEKFLKDPVNIEFKNVSFAYRNSEKKIIRNLNLKINAAEKIALVGENGAGKTTLVKLLCGFYRPTEGVIEINGIPIDEFNIDEYFKLVGAVFQDIRPFAFTIESNVSGKTEEATDYERLMSSIYIAGLSEKINSLPEKEKTYITQRFCDTGIELSGGETQKLLLARAIYKSAPFLILDEPTAALDPIAEKNMYTEYFTISEKRTSIFISHRLASTRFCDKIIFLSDGQIVESGTHEELMEYAGKYAELFAIQSQYYKNDYNRG